MSFDRLSSDDELGKMRMVDTLSAGGKNTMKVNVSFLLIPLLLMFGKRTAG